ncbi:MAG: glycosyltransferase family 2 protein [Patescibacteria group bacterium]
MLSVVITTWNEQKALPRAVASVKKIADEIVVVDTESTDDTVKVAKSLDCRVFTHRNTGIVEPVRNFSISKAKGDWILILDADEELPESLVKKITSILGSVDSADFYRIPRQNMIFGKWIESSHWWPDYVYRLFKKGHVSWEDTIHSVPFTKGTGADLDPDSQSAIIHHHYTSVSQYVARLNRYTDHQLMHLQKEGYNFSWTHLIDKPFSEFIRQYFARGGYKDGLHGLALSGLQAFSEFVLYLKAWETGSFLPQSIQPSEVSDRMASKRNEFHWWRLEAKINSSSWLKRVYFRLLRKFTVHAH